jgi:hypothetical protein
MRVNDHVVNYHLVDQLIGRKLFETIPYITWTVPADNPADTLLVEYYNTTVVKIVKDISPPTSPVWRIFRIIIITGVTIGLVIGGIYVFNKFRHRFLIKRCSVCKKAAKSRCSKCGKIYCLECSAKGCPNCGSRQFVRLK